MDKRSWPWKKKSSDKAEAATDTKTASLPNSGDTQTDQEHSNIVKYVQISMESYVQLTELEGQVIDLNRKISNLNGKLLSAQSEITNKDTLVKQHSKVAEEAVSGWEKAEAEALALKNQLESVMLLKLTAEDRASHLDDALKECMKQIRNVKEEGEQKLHDVVVAKSKQWENAKAQLEAKIMDFEQELLRSSTENAALSRSLQERCNLLMKISDEKSQVDAEIEMMKNDIQTCEREISSLKYELHVVSKELEIRNEEKNMSMRSADVANKQHLEDVKKIAKLEAECQRLRGLVRKKLPGPAALAQMKLEVESLGRDYGEIRRRRSPARSSSPHHISAPTEFSLENVQQCHKENEFLTARLLTMEEEMKMLKEALSMRNGELQASRNKCAKTASELHSVEAHVLVMNQKKGPRKTITDIHFENESNPASLTSIAEDGIDEEVSCYESLSTALMSESLHIKKEKNGHKANKADSANHLELMDDFLEMEKLACLSTEANESTIISDGTVDNLKTENVNSTSPPNVQNDVGCNEHGPVLLPLTTLDSTNVDQPTVDFASEENDTPASNLQSRIVCLFEQTGDTDIRKLLEDFRQIIQDAQQELPQHSVDRIVEESNSTNDTCMEKECHEDMGEVSRNSSKPNAEHVIDQELKDAISQILDFVSSIGEGPAECQDRFSHDPGLIEKIEEFSSSVDKVLCNEASLHDFIGALSHILSDITFLSSNILKGKGNDGKSYISDYIDKVTLLENKVSPNEHAKERFLGVGALASPSSSGLENEGPLPLGIDLKIASQKCSLEEFDQLKLEKKNMEIDLARCQQTLEQTKLQLVETESQLAELKLQLAATKSQLVELKSQISASEKSNSLAETQLKCMVESYKSLESRKQELETEVSILHTKEKMLVNELQEEKHGHQVDLAKYKELQEQIERNSKGSIPEDADVGTKTKQEKEIAAAAEKLAECQETIFLLCKQLNTLRPPVETESFSPSNMQQMNDGTMEDEPRVNELITSHGMLSPHPLDQADIGNATNRTQRTDSKSPLNGYNSHNHSETDIGSFPTSPLNSKHQKCRSSTSSFMSSPLPEKHGRGFSRFFSRKE
ncbi:filament-like plant protein 4 [Iris pallida]|uniref:Filament-like plant protein 4 n=1 Tax=Iris pallida TaxID=29817 RepID=A0AAX6GTR1_IRIPA|nr:filament-like plant protein 4 [Iris pallida]